MLSTNVEAILFVSSRPVSMKALAKTLEVSVDVVKGVVEDMARRQNTAQSGIHVLIDGDKAELVSNPSSGEAVLTFTKKEQTGPLTRPSVETLTIIAYRGPISKPEIEQIRGVNCSVILRNLLIRGLISEESSTDKLGSVYTVTSNFLKEIGVTAVRDLPEYQDFNENEEIDRLIENISTEDPEV